MHNDRQHGIKAAHIACFVYYGRDTGRGSSDNSVSATVL